MYMSHKCSIRTSRGKKRAAPCHGPSRGLPYRANIDGWVAEIALLP